MASDLIIDIVVDDTIDLTIAEQPAVDLTTIEQPVAVVTVEGPRGAKGESGVTGFTGAAWYYGSGAPGTILGSKPGDNYMDVDTGTIYLLGG